MRRAAGVAAMAVALGMLAAALACRPAREGAVATAANGDRPAAVLDASALDAGAADSDAEARREAPTGDDAGGQSAFDERASGDAGSPDPRLVAAAQGLVGPAGVCAVVARVRGSDVRVAVAGVCGTSRIVKPDEGTLFEIGSISKVFTTSLLAVEHATSGLDLDAPLARLLPNVTLAPTVRSIKLRQLATHTSGLPRMPTNWLLPDLTAPRPTYGWDELTTFLGMYTLPRLPGSRFEYSNLGAGVLGAALARGDGSAYEALLRRRILEPLGLTSTKVVVPSKELTHLAPGFDGSGRPIPARRYVPVLAGCCALHASAHDLAVFLAAHLGEGPAPVTAAFATTHAIVRAIAPDEHPFLGGQRVALGWFQRGDVLWHGGATAGYAAFAGLDERRRTGVVVLRNRAGEPPVRDAGFALLAEAEGPESPSPPATDRVTSVP